MVQAGDQDTERRAHERRALNGVIERLRGAFPDVPEQQIAATVDGRYAAFEDSRVRDFLPVLVERQARETLRGRPPFTG